MEHFWKRSMYGMGNFWKETEYFGAVLEQL
jgi:hypothetical protein